jgi:hypothetical protein
MASLSTDSRTGSKRLQFFDAEGQRRSVRLGRLDLRLARGIQERVETLVNCSIAKLPPDAETT